MELNNYIKQSYKTPNRQILQSLGASEELIDYLMYTPNNTNFNMLGSFNQQISPIIFDLVLTKGVDYTSSYSPKMTTSLKEHLYQMANDKFIAGKFYEYRCYYKEDQYSYTREQARGSEDRVAMGNGYNLDFIKWLNKEEIEGKIDSLCDTNGYCRIMLIEVDSLDDEEA